MMLRYFVIGTCLIHCYGVCAGVPSSAVVNTCLSSRQIQDKVQWKELSAAHLRLRKNFKQGYDAVYFLEDGKSVGVGKKRQKQAIIFDGDIYPVSGARRVPGFEISNADIDPFVAIWGTVEENTGTYLCINFPSGELGQSGSFQNVRNVLLLRISPEKREGVLYSVIGKITIADE